MQPSTTTTTTSTTMNTMNGQPMYGQQGTAANAYFDKPADKRLRPWILVGSLLLAFLGAAMIITPLVHFGHLGIVWGIFIAGIALAAASIFGFLAGFTLRPFLAFLFQVVLGIAFLGALAVLIINACLLNHNMNSHCSSIGAARFSAGCENVRDYNIVLFCVFGPLVALWVPSLLVAASYLSRTTHLYRKQEYDAYNTQAVPIPVGSSRM